MNVRKAVYQIDASMKDKFPAKTTSNDMTDELDYCHQIISIVDKEPQIAEIPAVKEKLNLLKEVTEDVKENLAIRQALNGESISFAYPLFRFLALAKLNILKVCQKPAFI